MARKKLAASFLALLLSVSLALPGCTREQTGQWHTEQYRFDKEGRLVMKIAPDGGKTTFEYNQDGLPVEINYPGGFVKYGYDADGPRLWMKDNHGATEYYYDAFNRLVGVLWQYDPTKLIAYDYDSQGNLTYEVIINLSKLGKEQKYQGTIKKLQGTNPAKVTKWGEREALFQKLWQDVRAENAALQRRWLDHEVSYSYDFLRRLVAIQTWQGKITYSYDPSKGQVQRRLPNGIITTNTFGPDGMLISLRHETKTGDLIAHYKYNYNAAGKISQTQETTPQGTTTTGYVWDTRGYLKELYRPEGGKVRYDYDVMGNRTLKEDASGVTRYTYDKFGRPVQAGNTRYQWNDNGQMTARWHSPKTRITYDGRGLPTNTRGPEGNNRFEWDGNGNLISQKTDRGTNLYIPQPMLPTGVPLAEVNNKGTITSNLYQGGNLLGKINANGGTKFYLGDGFNSLRFSSDTQGNITGTKDLPPLGEPLGQKGGEIFLPEIKTSLVNGRVYEADSGRFPTPNTTGDNYASNSNLGFWRALQRGAFLGTRFGEEAAEYWAQKQLATGNWGYAIPGVFASLWTPETWFDTATTVGGQAIMGGIEAATGKFLPRLIQTKSAFKVNLTRNIPLEIKTSPGRLWAGLGKGLIKFHTGIGEKEAGGALHAAVKIADVHPHFYFGRIFIKTAAGEMDIPNMLFVGPLMRLIKYARDHDRPDTIGSQKDSKLPQRPGDPGYQDRDAGFDFRKPLKGPDWPDGGGGGGAVIRDPFKSVEAKLGGIKLAAAGKFVGGLGAIKGAVFDPEKQCLVLLGDQELAAPQLKLEDLAVALLCVYGPHPQDPTFSLDPDDPKKPDGPWLKAVYRPYDLLAGTDFGNAMFEADWLLKQYSFGIKVDREGRQTERQSTVPGFKNSAELSLEEQFSETEKHERARLWIESEDIRLKRAGNAIYFEQAKLRVKAKKQVVDPKSPTGLADVETTGDFRAVKFANQFSRLYGEIAQESPEFERVRQLAMAVALAKWMKEQGVKVDMTWVAEYANKRVPMVQKVPRLSAKHERRREEPFTQGNRHGVRTSIRSVTLSGGVDLKVEPKFIPDDGPVKSLQKEVTDTLQKKNPAPVFVVPHNGKNLKGWVLPVTKVGQDLWKNYAAGKVDGVTYQFDQQQNVVKSDDSRGNVARYAYDAQNRLKSVAETRMDGLKIEGKKTDGGSSWSIADLRGHQLQYAYGDAGFLREVSVDGKKLANYEVNEPQKKLTVHLQDGQEKLVYDDRNHLKEIEFIPSKVDPAKGLQAGRFSFDYNQTGSLTRIAGTGIAPIHLDYGPDGVRPTRINSAAGKTDYLYNPDGSLKEITDPNGAITKFSYHGRELANLQVSYKGVLAEYRFTKDGLVLSRDLLGGTTEYGYERGRLVSVKPGPYGEARYTYDDAGRLTEIVHPDGSRTAYRYVEEKSKENQKNEAGMTLVVVTHPAPSSNLPR